MLNSAYGETQMTTARPSILMFSAFVLAAVAVLAVAATPLITLASQIAV